MQTIVFQIDKSNEMANLKQIKRVENSSAKLFERKLMKRLAILSQLLAFLLPVFHPWF